jgi:hypothetical protein
MPTDPENNRSTAFSPEQLAMINDSTRAAVQAAIAAMGPLLESIAVTPAKLREANRPYIDPKVYAREQRESMKSKQDEAEIARITKARRDACPHLDKNGRASINLVHNQPDHQPRGVCVICSDWIHPKEWRIGPPTDAEPRGRAYLVEPHKDYKIVMQLESMN